jgi:hypothetical protein
MRAQVLFDDGPLDGRVVTAYWCSSDGIVSTHRSKTDIQGVASFPVEGSGPWLLKLVHLIPCDLCEGVDWESHWAAFSYFLP